MTLRFISDGKALFRTCIMNDRNSDLFQLRFLQAIFESTTDGLLVVDHRTSSVTARNQRFLEIFNIPTPLWNNRDNRLFLEWVANQNRNPVKFLSLVKELSAEPTCKSTDTLELVDDRIIERHSEPVLVDGEVWGRVWYFADITEKIKQQANLMSASKMAGGIAHEINNPLAIIKFLAYQLQRDLAQPLVDRDLIDKKIKKIELTADRIANIVRSLRTFSRDGSKDPFEGIDFPSLMEETLLLCQDRFKNLEVALNVAAVPQVKIQGRPTELIQVFLNLINNAFDAVRGSDQKWVKVTFEENEGSILIFVTDGGLGISDDVREKIFQPFFTTKEFGKGTGLGLSISKGIVESHHGQIKISETSKNTQFIVRLPKL